MSLSHVEIVHFRNLSRVVLDPSPRFNLFFGNNGSGKTSLLEALYYLGYGRSFRTRLSDRVVQQGEEKFLLYGQTATVPIGIERCKTGECQIRVFKNDVYSASELVKILPLQLLDHSVYQLIDSGPQFRRQFLDWGVFHVEHQHFLLLWKKLRKLIQQRNMTLRQRPPVESQIACWTRELIPLAEEMTQWRRSYFERLRPLLVQFSSDLLKEKGVSFEFYEGWDGQSSLASVFQKLSSEETRRGLTLAGPQYADLKITVAGLPARDVLSRGQQKMLSWAMSLAQAKLLQEEKNKNCVFLVDDLASELDQEHADALCRALFQLQSQVFITGLFSQSFQAVLPGDAQKAFHVEQGKIMECRGE